MASKKKIYHFSITLLGVYPVIERTIQVEASTTLPDLHKIIQTTMGWTNSHLHEFLIHGNSYCEPDDNNEMPYIDYTKIKLNDLIYNTRDFFKYVYDFGDDWNHLIELEAIIPYSDKFKYPICLWGDRRCPPEDCGGADGFMNLLQIIKNKKHPEYKKMMEWLPPDYNPEYFDKDKINELLQTKDFGLPSWEDDE